MNRYSHRTISDAGRLLGCASLRLRAFNVLKIETRVCQNVQQGLKETGPGISKRKKINDVAGYI